MSCQIESEKYWRSLAVQKVSTMSLCDTTKVLVINPNNWYNKGDVSNRLGLIKALKRVFGDKVAITIETLTPEQDGKYFNGLHVGVVESVFSNNPRKKFSRSLLLLTTITNLLLFLSSLLIYRIFRYELRFNHKSSIFLHNLLNSDIVISSPGGFLHDYNIFSALIPNVFLLWSSIVLKKPVIIYAQSLGPFSNKILRFFMQLILNEVEVIILREELSKCYLSEANINKPGIFVTADATFSVVPPSYNKALYRQNLLRSFQDAGQVLIGISVIGEYFLNRKRQSLLERYVMGFANFINHIIDELNACIVFVPQVVSESEIMIAHTIKNLVKNRSRVLILNEDLPPEEVMKVIGCTDLFIGARMHSNIFALIMNVPVIAIAYGHKAYGIMKMLGLENWVIDIKDVDERKLALKVEELCKSKRKIKKDILKAVQTARAKSFSSATIIRMYLERKFNN